MLEVAASVLSAAGLSDFVIDLGDAGIARALLANVPADAAAEIADALGRKDEIEVADRMKAAGADPSIFLELLRVKTLEGGVKLLEKTPAAVAARRLAALHEAAVSRGLGDRLTADLGEIRSAAYYTGMIFRAYARGSATRSARAVATTICSRASARRWPRSASRSISTRSRSPFAPRPACVRRASACSSWATTPKREPSASEAWPPWFTSAKARRSTRARGDSPE